MLDRQATTMKAGAVEFLTKPFCNDVLLSAIRNAIHLSAKALRREAEMQSLRDRFTSLTPRQREILELVVRPQLVTMVLSMERNEESPIRGHENRRISGHRQVV